MDLEIQLLNTNYKIIDNFLDKDFYKNLKYFLYSESIPWYFKSIDSPNNTKNKNGFFSFCWYNNNRPHHIKYDEQIIPILEKLNYKSTIQVRANLVCRDKDTIETNFHKDYEYENSKTAILYFTTCNAKTVLNIDNKEINIDSIENRMLIFNSNINHKVIYQTDVYKRIVINFNYF